jgi:hypothetical protein
MTGRTGVQIDDYPVLYLTAICRSHPSASVHTGKSRDEFATRTSWGWAPLRLSVEGGEPWAILWRHPLDPGVAQDSVTRWLVDGVQMWLPHPKSAAQGTGRSGITLLSRHRHTRRCGHTLTLTQSDLVVSVASGSFRFRQACRGGCAESGRRTIRRRECTIGWLSQGGQQARSAISLARDTART